MVLFSLLVAGSFPIGQVIAYQIDPIALTFLRFLLASVLLGAFLAWRGAFRSADFCLLWRYLLLGGRLSFYFIFMFEALETATPVATSSIFTLMPFIAICLDRAFFAKRAGWPLLLSLLLGAWGALIVVFRGELSNLLALSLERGEGLFFLGTAAHAFYAVMVPKLRRGESALVFSFGVMVAATLLIFIAAPRPILALDVTQLGASLLVFGISGYFLKYFQFQLFKLRLCLFVERPTDRLYIFNTVLGGLAWSAVFGTKNCAIYDGGRQLNFDQFDFPASFRPAKGAGETVKRLSRARKRGVCQDCARALCPV